MGLLFPEGWRKVLYDGRGKESQGIGLRPKDSFTVCGNYS